MENTPHSNKVSFLRPARIFIVLLLGALFFAAPPQEAPKEKARLQVYPIGIQDASAQGCGVCQYFGCVEYIYNEDPEDGSDWTVCVRNGCKAIDGCVPLPPTTTFAITCGASGNNGWCRDSAVAEINVTNSQGQNFIIGGDVNGIAFPCNGTNAAYCSASLPEGTGVVSYVVYTDSGFSVTDSLTYQLDVTTPQIDGNVSGSIGTLDWFVTQAASSASASDALSGIASFEISVDGGAWTAIANDQPTVIGDGVHTIQYRAYDNAGNYTETTAQEIKVDTIAPTLNVASTGAAGLNNWYISTVTLTPTASDSISGLASLEVSVDGSPFTNYQSPITLSDGAHTVQFRATDQAGNVSQTAPQEIKVDTVTPGLSLSTNGTMGLSGWYVSNVNITPTASDAGSGVASVEVKVNDGGWTVISNLWTVISDGVHGYQFKVTDKAGNVTATPVQTVKVDTVPPTISAPYVIGLAEDISYQLSDPSTGSGQASGLNQFSITIADKDNVQPAIGSAWGLTGSDAAGAYRWSGQFANDAIAAVGLHPYSLRLTDMAGNETVSMGYIEVTRKALIYVGLIVPHNNPPSGSTGAIAYTGSSRAGTSNEIPSVAPTPEAIFGGETVVPPIEGQSTTVTEGAEIPFQSVSIQTGTSFTSGNQSTNVPIPASNVLWGSAAAAMLGATLAEWQRRREEEAALMARYASTGGDGGSDDDEMPEDVRARRRGKVIAKNQAKRAQEQAWENARAAQLTQQTQNAIAKNKNLTAAETEMGKVHPVTPYVAAGNIDRDEEKWLAGKESQRVWANVQAQEQAKEEQKSGNWLSNLWNAGVSAMGSALSLGDGGGLLSVRGGDPNPFTEWWNNTVVPAWDNFVAWLNGEKPVPTSTPDAASTLAVGIAQTMIAQTETARPTTTPTATMTPFPTITFTPTIAPTIALYDKPLNLKQWTDQAGRSTVEFCGAVLQREAHGAWQDDRWFDGRSDDPAKIFTEAAVRWYWSWIKDGNTFKDYGHNPDNPADRDLMMYNWIVRGMQSEDNVDQKLLNEYFDALNPNFTQVCNQILYPTNLDWTNGGNMQSWANAYLYTGQGQQIAAQDHLYQYGSGNSAWYILDGPIVKQLEPYKIKDGPEYPTKDGEEEDND